MVTATGGPRSATVAATLAVDEQQVNALFLDVVCIYIDNALKLRYLYSQSIFILFFFVYV